MRFSHRAISVQSLLAFSILVANVLPTLRAQAGLTQGSLSGTVTDTTGAAVLNARVILSPQDHSSTRGTMTTADGSFSVVALASGAWQLEVSAPGFQTYQNNAIAVAVGRDTHINVRLALEGASEQVTVQAQAVALDTSQSSPVTNIDRDRIEELPMPSRNYLNFTLLSPALAAANPAISRHVPGTDAGGFSAGGLRPSSNALYIDGSDDNDEYTGLSRTELSPEAINDFQIVNHGYAAQSGGSAGGSVEVESRAGTNLQHGDAFLFVQNGALNSTPALELAPRKPDESRLRAGLSTGGAIRKNEIFYHLAAEQEATHGQEASDFDQATAASINSALSQSGPLRSFHLQQGFFPTVNNETELSGRLDRDSPVNSLMVRYAFTNSRSVNDAFSTDDQTDFSSRGSAFSDDNSINGSWVHAFSPKWLNQMTYELSRRRVALRSGLAQGPGIIIPSIARFGTSFDGNSRRYEIHLDVGENMVRQHGTHLVEAGAAATHVGIRTADLEGFQGLYVFPSISDLAAGKPDFYIQSFGNPNTSFAEMRWTAWVQDHWTPLPGLAVDYGLRYDYNQLPHLQQHAMNLSPRAGFAWSPEKKLVLRGGAGVFFDRYLLSTINHVEEFNGNRAEQQIAEGAQAATLYQSGNWFVNSHTGLAPSIWQAQSNIRNPYAETASLGIEKEFPAQWTVSGEYRFVHGIRMGHSVNVNLPPPVMLTLVNAPSLGVQNPVPQQIGRLVFPPKQLNPAWDAINQFRTESSSSYNGITLTVNRQFTEDFEIMAGYTLSKTLDDASYDGEEMQNPYALHMERSTSLQDQRHRFVMSGLWVVGPDLDAPQVVTKDRKSNVLQKIVYGLELAPILDASSGFPDNPVTGADSNIEHIFPFASRPLGYGRNSLRTPSQLHFDLRVLKMIPIWRGHLDIVAESFNLLNRQNVTEINPEFGSRLLPDAQFGSPMQESDARRVQFSLDYEY